MVCAVVAQDAVDAIMNGLTQQSYAIVPIPPEEPQLVVHNITSWVPYSPELVVDMTGLPVEEIRDRYGDTVLVRMGLNGPLELKRGGVEPSPAEVRETAAILRQATASGATPRPSGTPQDAQAADGGISGRQDLPASPTGLSDARADRMAEMVIEQDREATQWAERLHKAEAALQSAEQARARVVRHAVDLAGYRPVEADALAAVILGMDPRDCRPGAALKALEEQEWTHG
jgi:hypothetical protein